MKPSVMTFNRGGELAEIQNALERDGVVIVSDLVADETMDLLASKFRAALEQKTPSGAEFYGAPTRRLSGSELFAHAPEVAEHLLVNQKLLEIADGLLLPQSPWASLDGQSADSETWEEGLENALADYEALMVRDPVLGPNCHHYRLSIAGASQTCKGEKNQFLHREMDIYRPFLEHDPEGPEFNFAVAFAVTDFTKENGATRVVPGSHKWERGREADEEEVVQAIMSKGSAAIWTGKTLHGLAASLDQSRNSIIFTMTANWLTTEENQFLAVPIEVANSLPERAQQILGYRASYSLGWVNNLNPDNLLQLPPGER